jgi:uncharacterized protein (DUF4415 family)
LYRYAEHAELFLQWAKAGNAELFESTKVGGSTLNELVKKAEEAFEKEPKEMVEVALTVVDEFKKMGGEGGGKKVLFAVDEYNAMYGPTDMHEVLGARKRGNIAAGSTRLNAALRDAVAISGAGWGLCAS